MKTAKIVKLTINEWDGQYGKMYSHIMELDNGENIKLNKKKNNSYKVGDTVNYEENGEGKRKEVKEEQPKRTFNPEATNKSATIGMALKIAFEVLYDKKAQNFKECIALAQRIYEEAMSMYNGNVQSTEVKDEEFDLPF